MPRWLTLPGCMSSRTSRCQATLLANTASMAGALIFVPTIEQGPAPAMANACACRAHGSECASKAQARKSRRQILSFSRAAAEMSPSRLAAIADAMRTESGAALRVTGASARATKLDIVTSRVLVSFNCLVGRSTHANSARSSPWRPRDPHGLSCPIGAHIRRANPRTGDAPPGAEGAIDNLLATLGLTARWRRTPTSSTLPWEENNTVWPYLRREDDAIASTRFHRILRRGREYGTKIDRRAALDLATPDPQAGIQFICLNANIARQFEFVQSAWLASAKFAGLTGEQDPLLGNREPFPATPLTETPARTDSFTRPDAEPALRRATGMPQFVTVKGGAYFFMPGLAALRWIASL